MAKTIFEEMGGTYVRQGDYFIPCLTQSAYGGNGTNAICESIKKQPTLICSQAAS